MSILADFIVATPSEAQAYDSRSHVAQFRAEEDRLQLGGFTGLELQFLWSILARVEWDPDKHDLVQIKIGQDGETWLLMFPPDFVDLLASLKPTDVNKVCTAWSSHEELAGASPEELVPIVKDLTRLAVSAKASSRGLFLWGSL